MPKLRLRSREAPPPVNAEVQPKEAKPAVAARKPAKKDDKKEAGSRQYVWRFPLMTTSSL